MTQRFEYKALVFFVYAARPECFVVFALEHDSCMRIAHGHYDDPFVCLSNSMQNAAVAILIREDARAVLCESGLQLFAFA